MTLVTLPLVTKTGSRTLQPMSSILKLRKNGVLAERLMEVGTGAVPVRYHLNSAAAGVAPTCVHVLHFAIMKIVDILALLVFVIWPKLKQQGRWVSMRTESHCLCLERQRHHSWLQISLTASGDLEGHLARLTQYDAVSSDWAKPLDIPGLQFVWWRVMLVAHQTPLETSWPTG